MKAPSRSRASPLIGVGPDQWRQDGKAAGAAPGESYSDVIIRVARG